MFSDFFGAFGASLLGGFDFGGLSGQKIGRVLGRSVGRYFDDQLEKTPADNGPTRLESLRETRTDDDQSLPYIFGTMRVAGKIIWTSPIETNKIDHTLLKSGGWGFFPKKKVSDYKYSISVAIALCHGEIARVSEIYANGSLLDQTQVSTVLYRGSDDQLPDPFMQSHTPEISDFSGTAYIIIKDIPLEHFNENIPKFEFTVVRPSQERLPLEENITSLCMIPASGEFVYATTPIIRDAEFQPVYENMSLSPVRADFKMTVDQLSETYPNLQNVSLVVGWFFDHIDPAQITIAPGVESPSKDTSPYSWQVGGYERSDACYLSSYNNSAAYGGTPADFAVSEGIIALAEKGYKVTFYPFLFGDVPDNHPDNIPAYPWRGRITPTGTDAEKTAAINHFYEEYRPMILHYAQLCKNINDTHGHAVDLFVIGSELVQLTHTKIGQSFPFVNKLIDLAAEVRAILGSDVKITYAADWTEYGHMASGQTLDFPLDALWADANIDYVGIDWYPPLSDMRDGTDHLDAALSLTDHNKIYLQNNIEGGEGYDWYYADDAARTNQLRTPISSWHYRVKDIRAWWKNPHIPKDNQGNPLAQTPWVPSSKPIILTEVGCPAVDKGANSPNLFPDVKSSENAIPPFSDGTRDDIIQRLLLVSYLEYWQNMNETSPNTGQPLMDLSRMAIWCIDGRPYPAFPAQSDKWTDAPAFFKGHWITARGDYTHLSDIFKEIGAKAGISFIFDEGTDYIINGYATTGQQSLYRILSDLLQFYGLIAIDRNDHIFITTTEDLSKPVTLISSDDILLLNDKVAFKKEHDSDLSNIAKLRFFAMEEEQDITNITTQTQEILLSYVTLSLPLSGFISDMQTVLEKMLYHHIKSRAETLSIKLYYPKYKLSVGDYVSFSQDKFYVSAMELSGAIATYKLRPITDGFIETEVEVRISGYRFTPPQKSSITEIILNGAYYLAITGGAGDVVLQRAAENQDNIISTYQDWKIITERAISGQTETDVYNRPTDILDSDHDIWVSFDQDHILKNANAADIALGANKLLIHNDQSDSWELISFEEATLTDPAISKYRLSKIRRGLENTASAQGAPVPAGAKIIIFDDKLIKADAAGGDILQYLYKI
ncbi:MAG: glycoside hydrolase TIM-barrel-like domain-containing protein [Pseudomonadota bacterium]